jgi:hypothetical protein
MGLYDKTDNYSNLCAPGPSGNTRSEVNHILEINESHSDNFILVIPRLPVSKYLSSYFNDITSPKNFTTPSTSGTPETTEIENSCYTASISQDQLRREENLDILNFRLYITDVNMPDVSINTVNIGTQFADIHRASKISFGDLSTSMLVSENLINYNIILFWMYALHNPEEYNKMFGKHMIEHFFTQIHLIITNNHREKVAEYKFIDAFPATMSGLPMNYKSADKLNIDVTWKHSGIMPSDNFVLKYV